MAKKSLGYVELEWVCPTCKARNPGSGRTCQGCGAPQPPDVKFVPPGQVDIIQDEAVARQAAAGPDIHCPYCDARNPANAKICKQCGGDLTQATARSAGGVIESFSTTGPGTVKCTTCGTENPANLRTCKSCGAPLPVAKPAAPPKVKAGGGNSCLLIAAGLLGLLVIGVFLVMMLGGGERTTTAGTVVDNRWVRTVEIMGLRPKQYAAWIDQVPADATLGACTEEVRREVDEPVANSREVCGTPYALDQGTGFAEVVQDCVYQVIERYCQYTVNEWQPVDVVTQEGVGFNPVWPALTGSQRQGNRDESYECVITANDATYVYKMRSFEEYQRCIPGSSWTLETNDAGRVLSAAPTE